MDNLQQNFTTEAHNNEMERKRAEDRIKWSIRAFRSAQLLENLPNCKYSQARHRLRKEL